MQLKYLLFSFCFLSGFAAPAHHHCSKQRISQTARKGTVLSAAENLYDVQYVKLDIKLDNTNTTVSGNATTVAKVNVPGGITEYAFELNSNMTIDSVLVDGVIAPTTNPSSYLRISTLPNLVADNTVFKVQVFYHGTAANGSGFFNGGVINRTLSSGTKITYTMSDDYFAKDWWPCKQSLQDKIDSADIWITVPANTKAGSNGLLQAVTPMGAGNRYEWKTKYPIDYYLISAAVAPYVEHRQTVHFSNSTDTMLVQHFMYDTLSTYQYKPAIDSTVFMVDHFSGLFGRYPFWKEKYGHCTAPLSGGMEHQTMTTLGSYGTTLIAHELGHQWWGNSVTYSSWRDIWMSEGWASYCEQLYVEKFMGAAQTTAYRTGVFNRVMLQPGGSVYVYDTTNVARTFDSRLTYDKGAAAAHMLRFVAPDDAAFFQGLQNYQQQYAYKTANTEQFKAVMETAYGYDLDTFFNQWVYGEGFPTHNVKWNQAGGRIILEITQTTSKPSSVPFFYTPLELKILSATSDTTVKIYNNQPVQYVFINWNQAMTGLRVDPNNHILNKEGNIARQAYLSSAYINANEVRVFPNPAKDSWQISGLSGIVQVNLYNSNGQLVWSERHKSGDLSVPASHLPAGQYELVIRGQNRQMTRKLLKW